MLLPSAMPRSIAEGGRRGNSKTNQNSRIAVTLSTRFNETRAFFHSRTRHGESSSVVAGGGRTNLVADWHVRILFVQQS